MKTVLWHPTPWELRVWRLFRVYHLNTAEIAKYLSTGDARYRESYIASVIRRTQDFIFLGGTIGN